MATDGGKIFPRQSDMDMATFCADASVQADDLTMFSDMPDIHTGSVPDAPFQNTANTGKDNAGTNILQSANLPD